MNRDNLLNAYKARLQTAISNDDESGQQVYSRAIELLTKDTDFKNRLLAWSLTHRTKEDWNDEFSEELGFHFDGDEHKI